MARLGQASRFQDVVMNSFISEVHALKPGNVSFYSEGHDMTVTDFLKSAELTSPILCNTSLSVGERILESVKMTISEVGCNTNLGMLLLFAPLVRAAELGVSSLHLNLAMVLQALDTKDTDCIFRAISHANPGGLGACEQYDVNKKLKGNITLKLAMTAAQNRDLIAKQYVTDFADIFSTGFKCIKDFSLRRDNVQWASAVCYMEFMARFPDSHIRRKYGDEVAEQTRINAVPIARELQTRNHPEEMTELLVEFDRTLKQKGINPGTHADLTAASLLVYRLKSANL